MATVWLPGECSNADKFTSALYNEDLDAIILQYAMYGEGEGVRQNIMKLIYKGNTL